MQHKQKAQITFTIAEEQQFIKLMDALLRTTGLQHIHQVSHFVNKMEKAFFIPSLKLPGNK
jgi:hypothetical protein